MKNRAKIIKRKKGGLEENQVMKGSDHRGGGREIRAWLVSFG